MNNENIEQIKSDEEILEKEWKEIMNKSFKEYHEKNKVVNEDYLINMDSFRSFREKLKEEKRLEGLERVKS